jgi:type IV pilus assembly protein PilC
LGATGRLHIVQFYKTPKGHVVIDKMYLQLPVFGSLLRKVAVARFTRTLGTMLSSGVPILDASVDRG